MYEQYRSNVLPPPPAIERQVEQLGVSPPANPPPHVPQGKVKLMDGERVVFTEESNPQNYLKLIASGDVDGTMLEALEDYVKRQKSALAFQPKRKRPPTEAALLRFGIILTLMALREKAAPSLSDP
jgi:hypothetical protein